MVLREYWSHWPASVTIGDAGVECQIPPKADLNDVVVNVVSYSPGELRVRLRRDTHCEYTVVMPVPQSATPKIMLDIGHKKVVTLRELGELRIS